MFGGGDEEALSGLRMVSPSMLNFASEQPQLQTQTQQQFQWGVEETRELIGVRGEMETMMKKKRDKSNKSIWEVVAEKMREKGYSRTPEQCKCKWKNLVNRYKGKETTDPENSHHFPFFNELHAIFTRRANMHKESEVAPTLVKRRAKRISGDCSSDDLLEDKDENEDYSDEERPDTGNSRKRKAERIPSDKSLKVTSTGNTGVSASSIKEMLREFLHQQQRMDIEWRDMIDRRVRERQLLEDEWRQTMEKIERERLVLEQAWRAREEERRMREEIRAEKRDTLLTTLLNKLINEN